jgi:hypothetical protein
MKSQNPTDSGSLLANSVERIWTDPRLGVEKAGLELQETFSAVRIQSGDYSAGELQ